MCVFVCVRVGVRARARVCARVCVRARARDISELRIATLNITCNIDPKS